MTSPISPSVNALLQIMGSAGPMKHRLDASETLLSFETAPEIAELAKGFLTSVVENSESGRTDYRLRASALLRRAEARRIATQSVRSEEADRWREVWRAWMIGKRRLKLYRSGVWPAPTPLWHADLSDPNFEPLRPGEGRE